MAALTRMIKRLGRSDGGAELIEFSLTLPLLLLVVLGIIEFGFLFREYEIVTNAAREGARIASLPTYSPTPLARQTNATNRVNAYLDAAGLNHLLAGVAVGAPVTTVIAAPSTCMWSVPVTVTYPHPVPFVGGIMSFFGTTIAPMTVRATSQMRTESPAGTCP